VTVTGETLEADGKAVCSALGDKSTVLLPSQLTSPEFDLIVGAAGGWAAGSIGAPSVLSSVEKMILFNINSAVATAYVAQRHLAEGGLLVLIGASSALDPTPLMIG
jgi:dihydropteridine reductase